MKGANEQGEREGLRRVAPKPEMEVPEPVLEFPLRAEQLTDFVTPSEKLFVLAHLGVPAIQVDRWSFDVVGHVGAPCSFRYEDLAQFALKTVSTVFQCAGNPLEPTQPARLVANVAWRGVLLRDLLEQVGIAPSCRYVWAYGLDYGSFFATPFQEHYVKDLPLDYVMTEDVIVATHLNGEPLSPKHGFPARIVAPGYYGTNSVKWLCRIEAASRRANGYFTRELYNDRLPGTDATKPVWDIAPESIIVSPRDGAQSASTDLSISGWAWSRAAIAAVDVSTDGGKNWAAAVVEPRRDSSWQRFSYRWSANRGGQFALLSRATDRDGTVQPLVGARNAVHRVSITVDGR
jgi:DMSO/TMAO reductase YedYZ molybdopterin-dependent catalytic subunit